MPFRFTPCLVAGGGVGRLASFGGAQGTRAAWLLMVGGYIIGPGLWAGIALMSGAAVTAQGPWAAGLLVSGILAAVTLLEILNKAWSIGFMECVRRHAEDATAFSPGTDLAGNHHACMSAFLFAKALGAAGRLRLGRRLRQPRRGDPGMALASAAYGAAMAQWVGPLARGMPR